MLLLLGLLLAGLAVLLFSGNLTFFAMLIVGVVIALICAMGALHHDIA